jgi:hypothetical protein
MGYFQRSISFVIYFNNGKLFMKRLLLIALLVIAPLTSFANMGQVCDKNLADGDRLTDSCKRGDIIKVAGDRVRLYCDFDKEIVVFPKNDTLIVFCAYSGKRRQRH